MKRGLAAEYATEHAAAAAVGELRARGFTRIESYSPVPAPAIDAALGARRSPLAIAAGIGALAGATGGYFLQWYLVAHLYPINAGGRPPHMPLPFTIITVEMGFLFGALTVFCAFVVASRLLALWDPMFEVPGFASATRDAFWLTVEIEPADRRDLERVLAATTPVRIEPFGGLA